MTRSAVPHDDHLCLSACAIAVLRQPAVASETARAIAAAFNTSRRFVISHTENGAAEDRLGFVTGAAGTALAEHGHPRPDGTASSSVMTASPVTFHAPGPGLSREARCRRVPGLAVPRRASGDAVRLEDLGTLPGTALC